MKKLIVMSFVLALLVGVTSFGMAADTDENRKSLNWNQPVRNSNELCGFASSYALTPSTTTVKTIAARANRVYLYVINTGTVTVHISPMPWNSGAYGDYYGIPIAPYSLITEDDEFIDTWYTGAWYLILDGLEQSPNINADVRVLEIWRQ